MPVQYAGHGLDYTYEGGGRNINTGIASAAGRQQANPLTPSDPDLLPGTADVSAPDAADDDDNSAGAGYLWDGALRAKLSVRNYGFFIDLFRYRVPEVAPEICAHARRSRRRNHGRLHHQGGAGAFDARLMTPGSTSGFRTTGGSGSGSTNSTITRAMATCRLSN